MHHICYVSVGSNMGNKILNCQTAFQHIGHLADIQDVSSFYHTEPWGYIDKSDYINVVLKLRTSITPHKLLHEFKKIEKLMGRSYSRSIGEYEARIIDLDILFFDNFIIDNDNLCIPHPRLYFRNFVLKPLSEIAPGLICPLKNKSILKILEDSSDDSVVNLYTH
ncbi:MAG: 2-amino-4-hydroxy-6-hydroxymethyldihydropteridine diphosphokinase [Flavobacteriales bacterium]|nr:2-amino-4-hydroxy-6-hydroxymethyldihydropteridine diphosphokinase [Flavobacteriales bacterium]|tara:strand:+ start:14710 stop:15204 length:495 start_codon:yes stop_codon:yes gene_type:complete